MIKLWIADGFQFLDPNRVILQLIVVSAELLRAAHIFMTTVLRFLQNRIELGNDLADFPLHAIDSWVESFSSTALQNDGSLLCQQFLDLRNDRRLSFGCAVVDLDINGGIMARTFKYRCVVEAVNGRAAGDC